MLVLMRKRRVILGALLVAFALGITLGLLPGSHIALTWLDTASAGGLAPASEASLPSSGVGVLPAPGTSPVLQAGPDSHFVGRGDFAELYWQGGGFSGTVYMARGGNPQKPETWLYYHILQGGTTVQSGYGTIPNDHLTGSGMAGLMLTTDTSAAANPNFTRVVGSGWGINITTNKIVNLSLGQTGNTQRHFFNSMLQINGQSVYSPASTHGTVINAPVMNSWAIMGMNLHARVKILKAP